MSTFRTVLVSLLLVVFAGPVHAGPSAADLCQIGRYQAAGRYLKCIEYWLGNGYLAPDQFRAGKCAAKYAATWQKFQFWPTVAGTECAKPRYADHGVTVTDRLTGLEWEKKTNLDGLPNPANVHDADNLYSWTVSGTASDGSLFTGFLRNLNDSCFGSFCDWRVPTLPELLTIVEPAYPGCTIPPCHAAVFGPTSVSDDYWTDTEHASLPPTAWTIDVSEGAVSKDAKSVPLLVRAVRGGS